MVGGGAYVVPRTRRRRKSSPTEGGIALDRPATGPLLSVVIPAYNEEGRIGPTLEKVVAYLREQPYTWEVVVVDDGSQDATYRVAQEMARRAAGVRVLRVPHGGKGWAVRHGMLEARGRYRFMCDADLAMPIHHLRAFLDRMEEGYDVVIGSRQVDGARRFNEPPLRHLMGRVFNWVVRAVAVPSFQDTQCGFKCFRAEVAQELFGLQRTRGFGFDVEVLYLALRRGMRVLELPIDWYHQRASKVRPLVDSFLMFRDALLVRLYELQGKYRSGPTAVPGGDLAKGEDAKGGDG